MNLAQPEIATTSQFERELIERFFHPRSFFLQNFLEELQRKEAEVGEPLYIIVSGLVVDQIIAAEDKFAVLNQLVQYTPFRRFFEQMRGGIDLLRERRLSTQQMMDVVSALGKSLADTLLEMMQDEEFRPEMLKLVGLQAEDKRPDELPEPESTQQSITEPEPLLRIAPDDSEKLAREFEEVAQKIGGEAEEEDGIWKVFRETVKEKLDLLEKHLQTFARHPDDWKAFRRVKDDFRDLRDWSMIQGDEGTEAISHKVLLLFEAVFRKGPEHRHKICSILQDALQVLREMNKVGRGSERLDIVRAMAHQIDRARATYPDVAGETAGWQTEPGKKLEPLGAHEEPGDSEAKKRPPLDESLQQWETVELDIMGTQDDNGPSNGETESEAFQEEWAADNGDSEDGGVDSDFLTTVVEMEEDRPEVAPEKAQDSEKAEKEFETIRESEWLSEMINQHAEELGPLTEDALESEEPGTSAIEGEEEFYLPGEDDQELREVLQEIRSEQAEAGQPPSEPDDVAAFLEELEKEYRVGEAVEPGRSEASAGSTGPAPAEEEDSGGRDLVREADMYFTFGRKALQGLLKDPKDRQKMEDLELALYSLKILGGKLGYRQVAEAFALAEKVVQNTLSRRDELTTRQLNLLLSLLQEIEKACREGQVEDAARTRWIADQMEILRDWVGDIRQEAEGNSSGQQGKDASGKDDPLNFLLFDDSSQFFKQLFDE